MCRQCLCQATLDFIQAPGFPNAIRVFALTQSRRNVVQRYPWLISFSSISFELWFSQNLRSQHFGHKFARVERREVVDLFAGADEARGNFQFILDRNHDSAFAAAVEFGHDQPR